MPLRQAQGPQMQHQETRYDIQLPFHLHGFWCVLPYPSFATYSHPKTNQKPFYTFIFVLCTVCYTCCNDFSGNCSGYTKSNCRNNRACCRNNSFIIWSRPFSCCLCLLCCRFYSRIFPIKFRLRFQKEFVNSKKLIYNICFKNAEKLAENSVIYRKLKGGDTV